MTAGDPNDEGRFNSDIAGISARLAVFNPIRAYPQSPCLDPQDGPCTALPMRNSRGQVRNLGDKSPIRLFLRFRLDPQRGLADSRRAQNAAGRTDMRPARRAA
jgi:hypothetical protein